MIFRVATLNLEQDQKLWSLRRGLIVEQFERVRPDIWALNEVHVPSQTGRWVHREVNRATGNRYSLFQQSKAGEDGKNQAEGLLTRFPVLETGNLDYHSHDCVALVARLEIGGKTVDVYVTHLIAVKVGEEAREFQAARLLDWIRSRNDADAVIVCGDFNSPPDQPSIKLMSASLRATQTEPTAFTPLREPGGKQPRQAVGEREQQRGSREHDHPTDERRLPARPIRHGADRHRNAEQRHAERGEQQPDHRRRRAKPPAQIREHRDRDRIGDEIGEGREADERDGDRARFSQRHGHESGKFDVTSPHETTKS